MDIRVPWFDEVEKAERYLVGVSGGLDSVALLHLLKDAGFSNLIVCHLNHGLRGDESDEDAEFVTNLANEMGLASEIAKVALRKEIEASGNSLETAGRLARHRFFSECAKKHQCYKLLLAHHADDQAETVLWNLLRGSHGCRGMTGSVFLTMNDTEIHVIRPLLSLRKSALESWMQERALPWREDASNREKDVVRNRLRNEALPLLTEISRRDAVPMLNRAALIDADFRELISWAVANSGSEDPQGRLHLGALRALPPALRRAVVADFLNRHAIPGLSDDLLERCASLTDPEGAPRVNLPGGGYLRRREGRLFIEDP